MNYDIHDNVFGIRIWIMRLILSIAILFIAQITFGQVLKPISWKYSASETEVELNTEIDLIFTATIDKNWYLYSSDFDPELGPMVTTFEFEPGDSYVLIGGIRPIDPKKAYDEIFEGDYTYFRETGEFRQTIKLLKKNLKINGLFS